MARVLRHISRQGNVLQQLDEARAEVKDLLVKYTAAQVRAERALHAVTDSPPCVCLGLQLSVQQLQRAMGRLSNENNSLTQLVTQLREQQSVENGHS